MAYSMTAFGRASLTTKEAIWTLEVHSLNRKNLELNLDLPKELSFLYFELRARMEKIATRGSLFLKLNRSENFNAETLPESQIQALETLNKRWSQAATRLGFKEAVTLPFLLQRYAESFSFEKEEKNTLIQEVLEPLCQLAFEGFEKMKQNEGSALSQDIKARIQEMQLTLEELKAASAELPGKYRKKLLERLSLLDTVDELTKERAAKEVAFFAERVDITEEWVRLESHFTQMLGHLKSGERSMGRALEFLVQEVLRELNTASNKANDGEAIKLVLKMKNTLEKIREQIQNIE